MNKKIMMSGKTMMKNNLMIFKKTGTDFHTGDTRIFMKSLRRITTLKNAKMLLRDLISLFHLKNHQEIKIFHREDLLIKEEGEV